MSKPETTYICHNCGQPVLQSDGSCWHCGAALKNAEAPTIPEIETPETDENEDLSIPLQVLFYALMTAITAFALLAVVNALGKQPRLTALFEMSDVPGVVLNAPDGSFSISLPSDLLWHFPQAHSGQSGEAALMVDDPKFRTALQPLIDRASDSELLLIAQAENGILALGRSANLGGIKVADVVAYAANESFSNSTVINARPGQNEAGTAMAIMTVEQQDLDMTCRQHIIPAPDYVYMAALCTDSYDIQEQLSAFNAVLNSLIIH